MDNTEKEINNNDEDYLNDYENRPLVYMGKNFFKEEILDNIKIEEYDEYTLNTTNCSGEITLSNVEEDKSKKKKPNISSDQCQYLTDLTLLNNKKSTIIGDTAQANGKSKETEVFIRNLEDTIKMKSKEIEALDVRNKELRNEIKKNQKTQDQIKKELEILRDEFNEIKDMQQSMMYKDRSNNFKDEVIVKGTEIEGGDKQDVNYLERLQNLEDKNVQANDDPIFNSDSSSLEIYGTIRTGEKKSECDMFDKKIRESMKLESGCRFYTEEKPYEYLKYNTIFGDSSSLIRHRKIQAAGNPYKCETCDKTFSHIPNLKRHKRAHTGERPYRCEICDKQFCRSDELKSHNKCHTGEAPHKCEICDKNFNHLDSLKKHKRIHTEEKPYRCEICDKRFKESSKLKRHSRVHTGEKPYKCEICDKCFSQLNSLKIHIRIHTGEKPYKCLKCDKNFRDPSNLKRHIYVIHALEN